MLENIRSIILRTVKFGDSSIIVDMLSDDYGRMSAVWRLSRSGKSRGKVSRNVFQPLTICDLTIERSGASKLPLIKDAHIAVPYVSLNVDPVKVSVAFFLAEFLCQVTHEGQRDSSLFDFTELMLKWYDLVESHAANFHLMFLVKASLYLGFCPNMETYHDGDFFDMRTAEFCSLTPLHRDFLRPDEAQRIGILMRMSPANMHLFRFNRAERTRTIEILLRFYAIHVPGFREMKTWDILRSLFD